MQCLHQHINLSGLAVLAIKTEQQYLVPHTEKVGWGSQLVLCKRADLDHHSPPFLAFRSQVAVGGSY